MKAVTTVPHLHPPAIVGVMLLLVLLCSPGSASAQSRWENSPWEVTMISGATYRNIYRLNGTLDTLISLESPTAPALWQQLHISDLAELRRVNGEGWWAFPGAVLVWSTITAFSSDGLPEGGFEF